MPNNRCPPSVPYGISLSDVRAVTGLALAGAALAAGTRQLAAGAAVSVSRGGPAGCLRREFALNAPAVSRASRRTRSAARRAVPATHPPGTLVDRLRTVLTVGIGGAGVGSNPSERDPRRQETLPTVPAGDGAAELDRIELVRRGGIDGAVVGQVQLPPAGPVRVSRQGWPCRAAHSSAASATSTPSWSWVRCILRPVASAMSLRCIQTSRVRITSLR